MVQSLIVILISLVAAYILAELFHKLKIPRVVGQICAGLLLGIGIIRDYLFTAENLNALSFLANLGIILLFYYVGLEIDFKRFVGNVKRSMLISILNTFIPFIAGFLVVYYGFNLAILPSIIIGLTLSVSSQAVCVDILEELKLLKTKIGALLLSTGTIDDLMELVLITGLLSLIQLGRNKMALTNLFLDMLIFATIIIMARLWFIPLILKLFSKEHSSTARFTASMIIVLLIASLSEILGFGLIIGALLAGMIVRQTILKDTKLPDWQEHDIARSVHIVAFGFLIPLFFVWIGVSVDLPLVFVESWLILILTFIALIGTIIGTVLALWFTGGSLREGLVIGWGLSPKGDIELVISALALNAGIISKSIFTALIIMSMITTVISPIIFTWLSKKYLIKNRKPVPS